MGPTLLEMSVDMPWETWTLENLLMELPEKWLRSLVAVEQNRPVGYAIVSKKPDAVHLHHLIVSPLRRSSGIGARLLERFIADARRSGSRRVTLKVLDSNDRAMSFYARHGFVAERHQLNGYVTMSRTLES
jgi:ribosomal protein S18 acetylase RimI-like enzyme